MKTKYDFSGWATKYDIKCFDGKTIKNDAFADQDGKRVPLVWQHCHDNPLNVIGHGILEHRPGQGVYMYGLFNDTEYGRHARDLVQHGDVESLSIFANGLTKFGDDISHGIIREVSLVLAGANDEAIIDIPYIEHDGMKTYADEAVCIMHGELNIKPGEIEISHEASKKDKDDDDNNDNDEPTIKEIIDSMTEEQKNVMYLAVSAALESKNTDNDDEEEENMKIKHNVFDRTNDDNDDVLMHDAMTTIIGDASRMGSLRESFISHAAEYGIENIDFLFPDAKNVTTEPIFINRPDGWVSVVMSTVGRSPFSRIKTIFADITADAARAKGYIKGNRKKDEVFTLLKRKTEPTMIYKKQKIDRDDKIDITDFDVVAFIKREMRMMLDEEIARAVLIGDGRLSSDDDKIQETNVRPIWTDDNLYTIHTTIPVSADDDEDSKGRALIDAAVRARKSYRGSGNPIFFTTEDNLTNMLLLNDGVGRRLYTNENELATAMRVSKIVTVPVMENAKRTVESTEHTLAGIIVNLQDYKIGADKGGAVSMFEDFDIDFNAEKYLIETKISGALVKPYSAIAIEYVPQA